MNKNFIEKLDLLPLEEEGGYFKRTFLSDKTIEVNGEKRAIASAIYYYLDSDDFSAWHKLACDEMWHFYSGSDLILHMIDDKGELECVCLGDVNSNDEAVSQYLIPANTWFAAEIGSDNAFALIGCTCFPAFDERDFVLGDRDELTKKFPQHKDIIHRLTRGKSK